VGPELIGPNSVRRPTPCPSSRRTSRPVGALVPRLACLASLALSACTSAKETADSGACGTTYEADPREADARTFATDVPGAEGTIRVQARLPEQDGDADTAWPIAVVIHGAWDAAGTPVAEGSATVAVTGGRLAVHFDLPGNGSATLGTDDRRGAVGRSVVQNVLRWAAGELEDVSGCTLSDRLPAARGPLVLVGASNGGNLALATLADPALELPPLAGALTWETPAAPAFVTVQWGRRDALYTPHTCVFDALSVVTCDMPVELLAVSGSGEPCFDRTGDGCTDDDVRLQGVLDPVSRKKMLAPELLEAIAGRGLRTRGYASADRARVWWAERDASQAAAAAVRNHPTLPFLLVASASDHVLPYPDHPHVHALGESLQTAGAAWVRLNPGRAWLRDARGENAPELRFSLTTGEGRLLTEDEEQPLEEALAAGVDELAGRIAE
jgi:alpha-beta hydrolase superfamily lysophospholipase